MFLRSSIKGSWRLAQASMLMLLSFPMQVSTTIFRSGVSTTSIWMLRIRSSSGDTKWGFSQGCSDRLLGVASGSTPSSPPAAVISISWLIVVSPIFH